MDGDRKSFRPRGYEELGGAATLGGREQDPFAGGAEREQTIQPGALEEGNERIERILVERVAAAGERRHGGRESAFQHLTNLSSCE